MLGKKFKIKDNFLFFIIRVKSHRVARVTLSMLKYINQLVQKGELTTATNMSCFLDTVYNINSL